MKGLSSLVDKKIIKSVNDIHAYNDPVVDRVCINYSFTPIYPIKTFTLDVGALAISTGIPLDELVKCIDETIEEQRQLFDMEG